MGMISDLQEKILKLKKENDVYILAHSYVAREICEIADAVGDSFQLSVMAEKATAKNIVFAGVHFMAETAKMLSPDKKVILANPLAGCPMAEQFDKDSISQLKEMYKDYTVVAYINTTAELKTVCDVCVTSSSAVKIVEKLENDNILFIPDCNLGAYVQEMLPNKNIKLLQGGCPVHASVTVKDMVAAKEAHPDALLLVHPECIPSIAKEADYIGSTSGIVDFAKKSDHKEFIIGTEMSIAEQLQYECPDKNFYLLSKKILCPNMKLTTLTDIYNAVNGTGGLEINMSDELIKEAKVCIDRMLELG